MKALAAYQKFHGKAPDKTTHTEFSMPKTFILLGPAIAVEYESDKARFKGDKQIKKRIYRHEFGAGVKLLTSEKRNCLFALGGKLRVTDWIRN